MVLKGVSVTKELTANKFVDVQAIEVFWRRPIEKKFTEILTQTGAQI